MASITNKGVLMQVKIQSPPDGALERARELILHLQPGDAPERWAEARGRLAEIKQLAKDAERLLDDAMLEHVLEHGPLTIGTTKYYAGVAKTTRCRDVKIALETLLSELGGDFDAVAECLSSNAWKHGAARSRLEEAGRAEVWERLFVVEERPVLKEGNPVKSLLTTDTRFGGGKEVANG